MLSKFDDYPIHQTPEPIAHPATTDRNVYDRFWFNGFSTDGEFYFGIALGYYAGRGIVDAAFSIVRDGEQHAVRASKRATHEPSDTTVGPIRIEIIEPMRSLRVIVEDNTTGITADLVFEPRTANLQEGRQTMRQFGRVIMDATRFAQFGRWRGKITYDGKEVVVDPSKVYGTKDRSWGVRPVGEPEAGGAPATELPQFFFVWCPIQWENQCSHICSFEDEHGNPWHGEAMTIPTYADPKQIPGIEDPNTKVMVDYGHNVIWQPGTRRMGGGGVWLQEQDGTRMDIEIEPLLCFRMKGIGYTHPEWGHGRWQGELVVAGESWKTADLDEMGFENLHVQQVLRAKCGDQIGYGVMENMIIGPYYPGNFNEFLDPAK